MNRNPYNEMYLLSLKPVEIYKLLLNEEIKQFPHCYWKRREAKEDGILCIKYLINEYLNIDEKDIPKFLTVRNLRKYKMGGFLQLVYDTDIYKLINDMYPNKYKPWQCHTPKNYWNDETTREAIVWLIENQLEINELNNIELLNKLSVNHFRINSLFAMLMSRFRGSTYLALRHAYPDRF